ncbi:sirohydrochlorin chelatase [Paenilisteria rocourtiae]|uniref:Sirohydrochlorin ferrochelatase n=1 Tax=Listeria rocourtiae TaxID=647910 RepID=A0A4R6ZS43_9LIST|nr:sirohydrochlorin chelatase [Listeria rocourtiae]MBC1603208.1 sirohydrochlorin chelatase [Listeria rocourtiae]TDR55510.1 sirohydrochlorin ferrochelatase [Listeria rocourtiae]
MRAIIYIGNGTQLAEGNAEFCTFIAEIKKKRPEMIQELGFLNMSYPTIEIACEKAIAIGADELIIVPVFLFSATNIKYEIPKILNSLTRKHPDITIKMTKTFGFDPEIIALAKEKILQTNINFTKSKAVLLVGLGSERDSEPANRLYNVSQLLEKQLHLPVFHSEIKGEPCYPKVLENLITQFDKIYILPYFLFTGAHVVAIDQERLHLQKLYPDCETVLCESFHYHPLLEIAILQKITELIG